MNRLRKQANLTMGCCTKLKTSYNSPFFVPLPRDNGEGFWE